MGFNALFGREDVLDILQKTLYDYYENCYPAQQVYIGYKKREGAAEFFLIPRVGMIIQARPACEIRKQFYSSYNIRGNLFKNIAAKLLVFASLHFPNLWAIKQRLYVWPADLVNLKTIFSYGNRSVRIYDYANNETVCIQKKGFTDKFFQNQLQFRMNNRYLFIPSIKQSGENWFKEEIHKGSILERITDENQYKDAQTEALSYMEQLQKDTLLEVSAKTYVENLCERLKTMLEATVQRKNTSYHGYAVEYLAQLKNYLNVLPETMPSVISHKDLQGGNILVTHEKLWIIDWETQSRGSRWFDAITMLYKTRYHGGIRRLTQDVQVNALSQRIGETGTWSAKQIFAIFLLEDLEFYLEDMLELPGAAGSATFDRYMAEIKEIDWSSVF